MDDPLLVSVEEAARRLGIDRCTAYELIAAGELDSVKIRRRRLVPVVALSEYVDRLRGRSEEADGNTTGLQERRPVRIPA